MDRRLTQDKYKALFRDRIDRQRVVGRQRSATGGQMDGPGIGNG